MICFDTQSCVSNSCDKCKMRLAAIGMILNPVGDYIAAARDFCDANPSIELACDQVLLDYELNEHIYQQLECSITGSCSHGCNPDLLRECSDGSGLICKLTGRVCDSQRLSEIVDAYSILNAPKGKTR